MTHHTQLEDKIEGDNNFRAWKYKISIILEENDLDQYITEEVPQPEWDEAKDAHKRSMDKAKRIIAFSIKDHLIPHVSSFKKPKRVYDSLKNMFKGKKINQKMSEEPLEECEDTELWDYTVLLHKGCSNQRTI